MMKKFDLKNVDCHATLSIVTKNAQSGRSMIEMLGVLAIIGVLSVGGIAGYSKAMMKYRINKTIEQITLIAGNIRTFFAPQKDFTDLGTYSEPNITVVKKAKLVPDDMWDGNNIVGAFGDSVNIYGVPSMKDVENDIYNSSTAFCVKFKNVPNEATFDIATQDWTPLNIDQMTACGSDWDIYGYSHKLVNGGAPMEELVYECVDNAGTDLYLCFSK